MHKRFRTPVSLLTMSCLIIQSTVAGLAQTGPLTRNDYQACRTQDEAEFRKAIRAITIAALQQGTKDLDFAALVRDQWRRLKLEAVVDKRVELATSEVRSETSWGQLLKSLAYRDKAKELASAVAERVYRSDALKAALEEMAVGVGLEVGKSIELTTADAARPAQRCLQAYLGPRYGRTVAKAVNQDAATAFVMTPDAATATASGTAIARNASGAITGAVILLVRRQMARMAQRIGQRVVGSVLGRLVAVVAGGIGVILIAKDVWDLRHGVLPIIATEMKSQVTKKKVRDELAVAIKSQIEQQLETIADTTSERIVDIWRDFKRAHLKVLQLAASNPSFKDFVNAIEPVQLPRLDEAVAIVLRNDGEAGLSTKLADGTLQRAVTNLDGAGFQIARETQSLDNALAWSALAGDRLKGVIDHVLHKRAKPAEFSRRSLDRLLSLNDRIVIGRLAAVQRGSRDVLFDLGNEQLIHLARGMEVGELDTLARYITGLGTAARQHVMNLVAESPARMRALASPQTRSAVLSSNDQLAAVTMMLRADQGFSFKTTRADLQLVLDRRVHPFLMWSKHPIAVVGGALILLFILLVLRRILFSRRRPPPPSSQPDAA